MQSRTPSQAHPSQSRRSSIAQSKVLTHSKAPSKASSKGTPFVRGHRPALSLNVVSGTSRGGLHTAPIPAKGPNSAVKPTAGHGRSLSIISLGSDAASERHSTKARRRKVSLPLPLIGPALWALSSHRTGHLNSLDMTDQYGLSSHHLEHTNWESESRCTKCTNEVASPIVVVASCILLANERVTR